MEEDEETGLEVHSAQKNGRENEAKASKGEREHWYRGKKGSIHILHISKSKPAREQNPECLDRWLIKNIEYS